VFKEFLFFIKYPYTAGTIATIWLGSAVLLSINHDMPSFSVALLNMIASVIVAAIGFTGKKEV
jgi:hypothetical protein